QLATTRAERLDTFTQVVKKIFSPLHVPSNRLCIRLTRWLSFFWRERGHVFNLVVHPAAEMRRLYASTESICSRQTTTPAASCARPTPPRIAYRSRRALPGQQGDLHPLRALAAATRGSRTKPVQCRSDRRSSHRAVAPTTRLK